jgi:Mn2+/Fe2+ NRAMP family transporter
LQAGFVEKRVGPRQYKHARMDVLVGSISCMVIVFFIIVCCAATLNAHGSPTSAMPRKPRRRSSRWQGNGRPKLFAFGLLNASLFAASILPLSTAHVICEGLGFEAGLDNKSKKRPRSMGALYGADRGRRRHHSDSQRPLLKILVFSQVANGVWLPVVLIFILLLINRRDLMGEYTNTWAFNVVAWSCQHHHDHPLTVILVYAGNLRARFRRLKRKYL